MKKSIPHIPGKRLGHTPEKTPGFLRGRWKSKKPQTTPLPTISFVLSGNSRREGGDDFPFTADRIPYVPAKYLERQPNSIQGVRNVLLFKRFH